MKSSSAMQATQSLPILLQEGNPVTTPSNWQHLHPRRQVKGDSTCHRPIFLSASIYLCIYLSIRFSFSLSFPFTFPQRRHVFSLLVPLPISCGSSFLISSNNKQFHSGSPRSSCMPIHIFLNARSAAVFTLSYCVSLVPIFVWYFVHTDIFQQRLTLTYQSRREPITSPS